MTPSEISLRFQEKVLQLWSSSSIASRKGSILSQSLLKNLKFIAMTHTFYCFRTQKTKQAFIYKLFYARICYRNTYIWARLCKITTFLWFFTFFSTKLATKVEIYRDGLNFFNVKPVGEHYRLSFELFDTIVSQSVPEI